MHILIAIAAGVALLYFWLIGHWFARVLMVLPSMALGACLVMLFFSSGPGHVTAAGLVFGAFIGVVAGWFLAGWPSYYWQGRNRRYEQALRSYPMQDWHRIQY